MTLELRDWQDKAWKAFENNKYIGIVEAVTAAGKSYLGYKVIEQFRNEYNIMIVVPTVVLMKQWYNKILSLGLASSSIIGCVGGGHKEFRRITVAVINSIRAEDLKYYNVLVMDECHRYLSDINVKLLENNKFDVILGLSATTKRGDSRDFKKFGLDIIFRYEMDEAQKNKDLCEYEVINVGVDLLDAEMNLYKTADETVKSLLKEVDFSTLYKPPWNPKKIKLRRAITLRKKIVDNSKSKLIQAFKLLQQHKNDKVILFCELTKSTDALSNNLKRINIDHVIYHSKIKDKNVIDDYASGKVNILLSVKALDEGLDVPETDVGIIVAGTKSYRQNKQRLGRILRKKEKPAILYNIYCRNTIDEKNLQEKMLMLKGYKSVRYI